MRLNITIFEYTFCSYNEVRSTSHYIIITKPTLINHIITFMLNIIYYDMKLLKLHTLIKILCILIYFILFSKLLRMWFETHTYNTHYPQLHTTKIHHLCSYRMYNILCMLYVFIKVHYALYLSFTVFRNIL